jgi:Dolichyl-phosphate-mannose-protein mannosyltransferase
MERRPRLLWVLAVSVAYLIGMLVFAGIRRISPDEGFYTAAARLVWAGKVPDRDFVYHQAPLLPYLYGWIWGIRPQSLVAMRTLSAVLGAVAVALWGAWLIRYKKIPGSIALVTFAVVAVNPYWIVWHTTVKTPAVGNVLATVAMIALYMGLQSEGTGWYVLAGMAFGAATSSRLLYAPLVPVAAAWLLYRGWRTSRPLLTKAAPFLAGAAVGLLPVIVGFIRDPQAFLFFNVRFRQVLTPYESFRHTVKIYLGFVLTTVNHLYFMLEVIVAAIGVVSLWRLRKQGNARYGAIDFLYAELALMTAVAYSLAALTPYPPVNQYFDSPLLPFLILFVAEGVRVLVQNRFKWAIALALVAPVLALRDIRNIQQEFSSAPFYALPAYYQITRTVESNSQPGDRVVSFWPGFIFESGRQYFGGSENQFNYSAASKVDAGTRARYRLTSFRELIPLFRTRAADLVILTPDIFDNFHTGTMENAREFKAAVDSNYRLVGKVGIVGVYRAMRDSTSLTARRAIGRAVQLDPNFTHARLAGTAAELDYMDKANSEMPRASPPAVQSLFTFAEERLTTAKHATEHLQQSGYKTNAARAAVAAARMSRDQGNYDGSARLFREQLQPAERVKNDGGIAFGAEE